MPLDPHEEKSLMRYLRGESPEDERDAIALRLAQDDSLFLALEELETEWIDRLARGELDAAEAEAARKHLRETGQEGRMAIAKAIAQAAEDLHGKQHRQRTTTSARPAGKIGWWMGVAAAACLVLAVAAWFVTEGSRFGTQPERERNSAEAISAGTPAVTIILPALQTRDAGTAPSPATAAPGQTVLLRLEIPEGRVFPEYRADWLGPDDAVLRRFPQEPVQSQPQRYAEFRIGPGTIPAGTHELALYGIAESAEPALLGYYTLLLVPQQESSVPGR
jgi:hypothetical protein